MFSSPIVSFRLLDSNIHFAPLDEDHIPQLVYFARICNNDMYFIERYIEMT